MPGVPVGSPKNSSTSGLSPFSGFAFGFQPLIEPVEIDYHSGMNAATDLLDFIVRAHGQRSTFALRELLACRT
jgi:hypothetical protein